MIKSITVTNHLNESITMTMINPENSSGFFIRNIAGDGLGPPKATIDMTEVAAIDGAIHNSARVTSRNIVLHLGFFETPSIEDTRLASYKYFPIKKRVKIRIETDRRVGETYGYIESNEPDIFSKGEGAVISIKCADSYFYSSETTVTLFSYVESLFEFPFSNESLSQNLIMFGNIEIHTAKSVYYTGDAAIGITMFIHAIGTATNIDVINVRTMEKMSIDSARIVALTGEDIHEGDEIIISTVKGNHSVTLLRNGLQYNVRNCLGKYPDWFQLEKGDNLFAYTAESGIENLQFKIESQIAYEGL
jgi:hypothetical protein